MGYLVCSLVCDYQCFRGLLATMYKTVVSQPRRQDKHCFVVHFGFCFACNVSKVMKSLVIDDYKYVLTVSYQLLNYISFCTL
jgi:hypothetical protein